MFEFLSKFEFWQVAVLIVLVSLPVLLIIFRAKLLLSSGNKTIKIGQDADSAISRKHASCPFVLDIEVIINETVAITYKISDIRHTTLFEQMYFAEQKLGVVQEMFMNRYAEILLSKNVEDPHLHQDFTFYKMLVRVLQYSLKTVIKDSFINNHLLEKSDTEFRDYVQDKKETIFSKVSGFLDDNYTGEKIVKRNEIGLSSNNEMKDKLSNIIEEIFYNALKIAQDKSEQIKEMQDKYRAFVNNFIGGGNDEKTDAK